MQHMFFDFIQRKSYLFHNQNGVQVVNLAGAVIAVSVIRIHIGGAKQADLIIKN